MGFEFTLFAESCPSALSVFDDAGRLIYANNAFRELLPAERRAHTGLDPDVLTLCSLGLMPSLESALIREFEPALHDGKERQFVWEGPPTARRQRFLCRVIPTRISEQGERKVVIELREDPGPQLEKALEAERVARARSERLKERARKLFFALLEELPVFVYMQRRDYTVAYANRKTKAFYGETEGRLCYEVFSGRDSPCPCCPTFRVFETGEPENWQFTDNEDRVFHIYDYPFEDEDGDPLVIELGIDVTELKRVEGELFQAQKMRSIGILAGGIAHDLNNNLVPIIFNIDYVLGKSTNEVLSKPLKEALRAAYRAADLVEQVLEYSRQQNVSRSPLRLIPLARENLELLQASLPENVLLEVDYVTERDCISANPAQVQQLLLNLCRNAVQAMPDGGTLRVSVGNVTIESLKSSPHPGLRLGEYIVLRVEDTGHGIEPDKLERIFEPFYTSKKKSGGTGMGLAVVHAIATCNGGGIHVDSTLGVGTVFTVYLPAIEPVDSQLVGELCVMRGETGRLLLVDDDSGALHAMERVLLDAGFEVSTAECGAEGLKEYLGAEGHFDMVLADLSMPGMTGIDMAARILERDSKAKIIICTGHVEPKLEQQANAAGIAGFVMKPMTPRSLVEVARRYCR